MSSDRSRRTVLVVALLAAGGCADFTRGPYWTSSTEGTPAGATGGTGGASGGPALSFAADVYPILVDNCQTCHSSSGEASNTSFIVAADASSTYSDVLDLVDLQSPGDSRLLQKMRGESHTGGVVLDPQTADYQLIQMWIEEGAKP